LGLKAPTPNRKDARFTFHMRVTRRAVQSAIADLLAMMFVRLSVCLGRGCIVIIRCTLARI